MAFWALDIAFTSLFIQALWIGSGLHGFKITMSPSYVLTCDITEDVYSSEYLPKTHDVILSGSISENLTDCFN